MPEHNSKKGPGGQENEVDQTVVREGVAGYRNRVRWRKNSHLTRKHDLRESHSMSPRAMFTDAVLRQEGGSRVTLETRVGRVERDLSREKKLLSVAGALPRTPHRLGEGATHKPVHT